MTRLALHWQILSTMLLGALLGIVLNASTGSLRMDGARQHGPLVIQHIGMSNPISVAKGQFWASDSPEVILLQIDEAVAEGGYQSRRIAVGEAGVVERFLDNDSQQNPLWPDVPVQLDPTREVPLETYPALEVLAKKDAVAFGLFEQFGRSRARVVGNVAKALGDLFLRMLKMVSIPLIITSLISGITGLGRAERLGKMFGRTILYYLSTSLFAIFVGLAMVNLIRPGVGNGGIAEAPIAEVEHVQGQSLTMVLFNQLKTMIPDNPFEALAEGTFLSIIAFSLMFGVCTIWVGGKSAERISDFFDAAFHVMMRLTMVIIELAPIGVFFLMLSATATQGAGVFQTLGWYMLAVTCALLIHAMVVLPCILKFVAKRDPWTYAKAMSPALLTAFSSASSNGTLPLTLTCVEERAGISNRVGSFVLPLGATINMDGTALYEVVAVLFIAQFSGIELSMVDQLVVAFTALLASIGAAGIPHAGLVMMVIILQAVGLPTESQGLIIAVDRVLDMLRTAVNVWSDSCGCAVIGRYEAEGVKKG